jgi:glycosyltransferase involved in cell wall biosynthesis
MTMRMPHFRWVVEDAGRPGGVEAVARRVDAGLRQRGTVSHVHSWLPAELAAQRETQSAGAVAWLRVKVVEARRRRAAALRAAREVRAALASDEDLLVLLDPGSLSVARHLVGAPRWGLHVHWQPDLLLRPWRHLAGDGVPPVLRPMARARALAQGWSQRRLLRRAPFLVTLTPSHTRAMTDLQPNVHEVANPVDVPTLPARPVVSPAAPVVLSYVGRLSYEKGADVLLEALALLGGVGSLRVLVAGNGPLEEQVRHRAEAELSCVELLGWVDDPYGVLAASHVLVFPSRAEAVPLVIVEALAAGCVIVASDAGSGVRDLLLDGVLGRIVPADDPTALAAAIEEAVDSVRRGERPDLRAAASVVERHDPELVLDRWIEVGCVVLGEHAGST